MKLLLAIEQHVTAAAALSPPLPGRGREYSRPSTIPSITMDLEGPWGYPGQSTVESGSDVLKAGSVTGTLLQSVENVPVVSTSVEN